MEASRCEVCPPVGPRYRGSEPLKREDISTLNRCRHRPAASLDRQDAVMFEGGKEVAENKRIARRPEDG